MTRHVQVLTAPLDRSDFASDEAYQRYLDGLAAIVDMLFTQRSRAETEVDADRVAFEDLGE